MKPGSVSSVWPPKNAPETSNNSLELDGAHQSTGSTGKEAPRDKGPRRTSKRIQPVAYDTFIVATGRDNIKPDENSRRLIRSQAMTGRKRRPAVPNRPVPGSWINGGQDIDNSRPAGAGAVVQTTGAQLGLCPLITSLDLNVIRFAADVQPYMVHLMYEFLAHMKGFIHPIERYVDLGDDNRLWIKDLGQDPAYVHALVFLSQAYLDLLHYQKVGTRAIVHMNKTISYLRERLTSVQFAPSNSILFVVLSLAMATNELGDFEAARNHLHGLHRMVMLRGGLAALVAQRSLQMKICRLDLAHAIQTGSRPLFFAEDNISWALYVADPRTVAPTTTPIQSLCENPDSRLDNVWLDLREFARAINVAVQAKRKIDPELFQETLVSGQYRLLQLSYDSDDAHELLRLGLLAFTTTLFLDTYGIRQSYAHLGEQLRTLLRRWLDRTANESPPELNLWLIMMLSGLYNLRNNTGVTDYSPWVASAYALTGSLTADSSFVPIDGLFREDANLFILFLSSSDIIFADLVDDPWDHASRRARSLTVHFTNGTKSPTIVYEPACQQRRAPMLNKAWRLRCKVSNFGKFGQAVQEMDELRQWTGEGGHGPLS
ncbi:hypothetical protein GQ53DRAFT_839014 [Thozetella sp. PMI_491]|nr:hypothetical protein GQ53DRAFT_839014 [Thozetella sp. PMI_491]